MKKAIIFQKNISPKADQDTVKIVLRLNGALVEFEELQMKIIYEDNTTEKIRLEFFEEDYSTISYKGVLINETQIRIVKPTGNTLEMVKQRENAEDAFSIGSISPDGFGIHFILVNKETNRIDEVENKSNENQLSNFFNVSILAYEFGLDDKFSEFTKRLLDLIKDEPKIFHQFERADELIKIMHQNLSIYSFSELRIIREIVE